MDVNIPLAKKNRSFVVIGANCLLLSCFFVSLSAALCLKGILEGFNSINLYAAFVAIRSVESALGMLIAGPLGNKYGRKKVLTILLPLEFVSALICGLSGNFVLFTVAINVLGIVNGTLMATGYAIITDVIEKPNLGKYFGYVATLVNIAMLGAPLIAGALNDLGMASLTFLIPAPFILVSFLATVHSYQNKKFSDAPLDLVGFLLISMAIGCFLVTLSIGGVLVKWTDAPVFILLGIATVSGVLTFRHFQKVDNPILDFKIFKNKQFGQSNIFTALRIPVMTILTVNIILYITTVLKMPNTAAGALSMPKTILTILLPSVFTAFIIKTQRKMFLLKYSFVVALVSCILLSVSFMLDLKYVFLMVTVAAAISGVSESMQSVTLQPYALSTLNGKDLGSANSLTTFIPAVVSSVFTAFFGMINNMAGGNSAVSLPIMAAIALVCSIITVLISFRVIPNDELQAKK